MRLTLFPLLAMLAVLTGCSGGAREAEAPAAEDDAYASPPAVTAVRLSDTGGLTVIGSAEPGERIRLIEMNGTAHGVTTDARGVFELSLNADGAADRLFSVNVQRAGQAIPADGWLMSPAAAPERAVMLRPGDASLPVGPAPLLAVVDVDAGGGVALSGVAEPGAEVEVRIDGVRQGVTEADATGRWSLTPSATLPAGEHRVLVIADVQVEHALDLTPIRPTGPMQTEAVPSGLRIAWGLPGGGAQTTFLILSPDA
ncbi:hypothetical protein [Brevundimonas sp.]|uniref:hypothetical protein n=1 Tax=Brevundimonas sp. TaxID=1871086 RepID=UPI0025D952CB|nr:hypothetical protein [Brevundimonas sp.]